MTEDFSSLINPHHKEARLRLAEKLAQSGITDINVLNAIAFVPREYFVHPTFIFKSYDDIALPLNSKQTISRPSTVAFQSQLLGVSPGEKILEIGTGSGYQACILKVLGAKVFSVERVPELYNRLVKLFADLRLKINLKLGDGTLGWQQYAPYDGIIVTAAAPELPSALAAQLAVGGRLVIPIGDKQKQTMHLIERVSQDKYIDTPVGNFSFVPLIGEQGWDEDDK
ncbi:MAG: protein-L-isoaspartate(D-aspartate) O-methyltransferase [Candidatus Kapabacteria bacterium]|nr:protein-L-isoaspartate(D-aspartate) O-methyltransferase [Candidatus Kapabacteria bacterium]